MAAPFTWLTTQLRELRHCLPGVRDGHSTAIHDARVATRRIREVLALLEHTHGPGRIGELSRRFHAIARTLGRVRDADVRIALLHALERRIPRAAPTLALLLRHQARQRAARLRMLSKRLEREDVMSFVVELIRRSRLASRRLPWRGRVWERRLDASLVERAEATRAAMARAAGAYVPHRSHAVRIAVKKLRYALEITRDLRHEEVDTVIGELKAVQEILGELHDRQVLLDDAKSITPPKVDARDMALIRQVLDAEMRHLHGKYLRRRRRLNEICAAFAKTERHAGDVGPFARAM